MKQRRRKSSRKKLIALLCVLSVLLAALVALLIALEFRGGGDEDTGQPTDPPTSVHTDPTVTDTGEDTTAAEETEPSSAETEGPTTEEPTTEEPTTEEPTTEEPTTEEPTTEETTAPTESTPPSGNSGGSGNSGNSGSGNKNPGSAGKEDNNTPGSEGLSCKYFSRFSGQYVEDSRDEMVENVAAMLVTNTTDRYLDIGMLYYSIDGKDAIFIVTGLPAGESAWVMEATQLTVTNSSTFTFVDMVTSFRDDVVAQSGEVSITVNGNMLTATNNTSRTLNSVCVYYKSVHTDGNYFGGITYLVDFGTLAPGESAEVLAGHYSENSRIVRIGWLEDSGT